VVARTWRRRSRVRWVCQGGVEGMLVGGRGVEVDGLVTGYAILTLDQS